MRPVNKLLLSALGACSDSPLLDVAAVKLDAPPWLMSDSQVFLFFGLTSGSLAFASCSQKFENCKSQALLPSIRLTQRVFVAPVGVSKMNPSVLSSLPTKTPRIHLTFNLAPSSEWYRPKQISPNGTTSPVLSLPSKTSMWRSPRSFHLKIQPISMYRSNFCLAFQ